MNVADEMFERYVSEAIRDTSSRELVVDIIERRFVNSIREKLINGEEVELDGIGILAPYWVKYAGPNKDSKPYQLRLKLYKDQNFNNQLLESYENDPSKFHNGQKRGGRYND